MADKLINLNHLSYVKRALDGKTDDSELAAVAKSGSYNDLTNRPIIPSVYNGKLTVVDANGNTLGTFTANQSSNTTISLELSTKNKAGLLPKLSDDETTFLNGKGEFSNVVIPVDPTTTPTTVGSLWITTT